jgi:arylsulfatase A-like enzyme
MVSLVDLPATVLDYAPLTGDPIGRAQSLRGLIEGGPAPRRYLLLHSDFEPPLQGESAQEKRTLKWGVVDGLRRLKYVEDRLAGTAHLYDLAADPGELVDLAGTGRPEEAELAAVLLALERGEDVE